MKRSAQVALVVMAATGVGASSYALRPTNDCAQPQTGAQTDACRTSRGGGGHYYSYSSSTPRGPAASQTGSTSTALVGGTERGGFGGFARSVGAHFSGG